jgi:hypothetical protein
MKPNRAKIAAAAVIRTAEIVAAAAAAETVTATGKTYVRTTVLNSENASRFF